MRVASWLAADIIKSLPTFIALWYASTTSGCAWHPGCTGRLPTKLRDIGTGTIISWCTMGWALAPVPGIKFLIEFGGGAFTGGGGLNPLILAFVVACISKLSKLSRASPNSPQVSRAILVPKENFT